MQSGTVPTDKRFTGQTLDASSGLYHYGARYYDAGLARFIQPDTLVPQPGNPQALNRYSYVLNNPLRYTDPTGHQERDLEWEEAFKAEHGGQEPTLQDWWLDYQVSLAIPGSGLGGAWTEADWEAWTYIREADPFHEIFWQASMSAYAMKALADLGQAKGFAALADLLTAGTAPFAVTSLGTQADLLQQAAGAVDTVLGERGGTHSRLCPAVPTFPPPSFPFQSYGGRWSWGATCIWRL